MILDDDDDDDDDDGLASSFFLGHIEIHFLCLLGESVEALRKLDMLRQSSSNFGNAGAVENLLKSAMLLGQADEVPPDQQMANPLLGVLAELGSCNLLSSTIDVGVNQRVMLCPSRVSRAGLPSVLLRSASSS